MAEFDSTSSAPLDISSHFPLQLIKSEIIPPAPNRPELGSDPAIDWLLKFAGYSWIAYGASSLLVIVQFPNPLAEAEKKIGPIFRQVIDSPSNSRVSAVSWSPAQPSGGEIGAASEKHIRLFSYQSDHASNSSFCWSQTAMLSQSTNIDAIQWTRSGDGIVSVGSEVVLWRRKEESWEIAWKFKPEVPQILASATWSIQGFSATAPKPEITVEASKCVLVCRRDEHYKYLQVQLHHPMPVGMIQWRPSNRHAVLLTCCLDGAVRLWSQIDEKGRIRRAAGKEMKLSFCVVAVIEVNQTLNGSLGSDVFVSWAMEVEGIDKEACYYSSLNNDDNDAGKCEWLIGFGPKRGTTLWSVHCLDDFAPVRFPRITLFKKKELLTSEIETSQLILHKVFMTRHHGSGPPVACSLVQLLPCNSFAWTHLYSQTPPTAIEVISASDKWDTEKSLSSCAKEVLKVDGHIGKILQLAIHRSALKVQVAASLDINGNLLFWSSSTFFNSHIGLPASTPSWKLSGNPYFSDHYPNYACLGWAPTLLIGTRALLLGHTDGIDCFLLRALENDEENDTPFHKLLCSIRFGTHDHEQGPSRVCTMPLPSNCNTSSKFLLVAFWMDCFQALSWEVTIHCYDDLPRSCCDKNLKTFESDFSGKQYSVSFQPCSSVIPSPHNDDKVTSCAVVCPSDLIVSLGNDTGSVYHMVTGYINGSVKLWRSMADTDWNLVGVLICGQGPIMSVSPSPCCRKIATISSSSTLCIWECMHVQNVGSFMLEDKLYLPGVIIALDWLVMGNGQLLLGLCLQNEVRVYVPTRRGIGGLRYENNPSDKNVWVCIAAVNNSALPAIRDFVWGPKGTIMVVHDEYFSVFSQFLLLVDDKKVPVKDSNILCNGGATTHTFSTTSTGSCVIDSKELSMAITNVENCQRRHGLTNIKFWSMSEIAQGLGGSLPLFHPESLLTNIYSGNWTRPFVALRHLVKHIASRKLSEKGDGADLPSNRISPIPLSNYFEGQYSSSDNLFQWSSSQLQTQLTFIPDYDTPDTGSNISSRRSEFIDFYDAIEWLDDSGCINKIEKMQALAVVDLLREVSDSQSTSAYGSIDEPGRRFWVAVRFEKLFFSRRSNNNKPPLVDDLFVSSEMIAWAFHSDCHESLFNSLLSSEPSWKEMRSLGVGFWYSDATQLRSKMERLGRQQFMNNKDPKACALLYIALNRIQVLAGLFKISKDDKDKPMAGFLLRNFQEDKNKEAALKNAYVLMGKHQLELAISFFLLGGDFSSAVTVCAKNLGDEQLALVICRLVEGYGGRLEHNLISKFLLPSALSKCDYWKASFLEWILGNYSSSFLRTLGVEMMDSDVNISFLSSSHSLYCDPSIAQYCLMLASKTSMKNAIGEYNAVVLSRLALSLNITSLSRRGLHLEALECLSSSVSLFGNQGSIMHSPQDNLHLEILNPYTDKRSNWISDELSCPIILNCKSYLALQYMSDLLREHPSCADIHISSFGEVTNYEFYNQRFEKLVNEFQDNLTAATTYFQMKFSLNPLHLVSMAVLSLRHNGLEFIGYNILHEYMLKVQSQEEKDGFDSILFPIPSNFLLKATEEISVIFAKYCVTSCINCSNSTYVTKNCIAESRLISWGFSNQGITWSLGCFKAMLRLFYRSYSKGIMMMLLNILALMEYNVLFASALLQRNFKALLVTVRTILIKGYEMNMEDVNELLSKIVEILASDIPDIQLPTHGAEVNEQEREQTEDRRWKIMSSSLWVHMVKFVEHKLSTLLGVVNETNLQLELGFVSSTLVGLLKLTGADISFYCSQQFVMYLNQEVESSKKSILLGLEDVFSQPGTEDKYNTEMAESSELLYNVNECSLFEQLWHICADQKIIHGAFLQEYRTWLPYLKQNSSNGWNDAYKSITREYECEETCDKVDRVGSPSHAVGSPLACLSPDDHPFKSFGEKDDVHNTKRNLPFFNPKEIHKRNGELLEALCVNSLDHRQAALASNKKGIIFFNWEDGLVSKDPYESLWGEADWPHNGWAGSVSTPIPTCVSPGVGLGSKKGIHLGLGGGTIGALVGPGKDYGGRLGWGVEEEDFDEFVDPPATVDNVRTRAFASHPSRPFFMVGSSNTHIYLWEFGEDKAVATYGVLPAANVPPPYALASVSAVRFDQCGHRFVSAASDGTVCTWELEVGGRSNIRPTESATCFNNHTADVTYVTASGSIIAAAGYSSNGVNVVVWDTLAPPNTSRASIMCHEGGARSLNVFDNDIGSGSISPLIVTGGKGGDVGLHDFRYIATGRTKKHKNLDNAEHNNTNSSSAVDMRNKTGDQNRNGMLWYIPKAHSGSITKISTIPNTSFFLTGSKDGDVKLWDAKRAKLVFHWPRLHERQSSFGGIARAAITDIQVVSHGFLTCGGDGSVKFVKFQESTN